jgi:L-iditol 2-dehydrogenase
MNSRASSARRTNKRAAGRTALIHYSGLKPLAGFHHTPRTVRKALELIEAGVIHAGDFVNGECPLSRLPDLFKTMATGNRVVKTLVHVRQ